MITGVTIIFEENKKFELNNSVLKTEITQNHVCLPMQSKLAVE